MTTTQKHTQKRSHQTHGDTHILPRVNYNVVTPQTGTIGTDEGLMVIVACRLLEGALVVNCASCLSCGGAAVSVSRGLDRGAAESTTDCVRSNCHCYCLNFLLMFQEKFFGVEPHADFCRPCLVLLQSP